MVFPSGYMILVLDLLLYLLLALVSGSPLGSSLACAGFAFGSSPVWSVVLLLFCFEGFIDWRLGKCTVLLGPDLVLVLL